MPFEPPEEFNMADWFLDARLREGRGGRVALRTDERNWTYAEIASLAARYGSVLAGAGVEPEQRVILALDDGPGFVGALFGVLKIGAVVVMVNPRLPDDSIAYFVEYTRSKAAIVEPDGADAFRRAGERAPCFRTLLVAGEELEAALSAAPSELESFPTHRDDSAIWLFSGGTTGRPKAVLQTHASYANTTECYGKGVLGISEDDVTMSVPKLFFGYATGSNLLFPFSVGASAVLFREHPHRRRRLREDRAPPADDPRQRPQDGRAHGRPSRRRPSRISRRSAWRPRRARRLPVELHRRWDEAFGVDLLDGLGTAEMWHIFLSNRPGDVRPGTLGKVVPGFDVEVRDDEGRPLPDGEVGWLWVRGGSRAIGYWHRMSRHDGGLPRRVVRVGDMVSRGRRRRVHLRRPRRRHAQGLRKVARARRGRELPARASRKSRRSRSSGSPARRASRCRAPAWCGGTASPPTDLADELRTWVRERLEPYKYPREVVFMDALPRTHLGKVDRAALRELA